MGQEYYLGLDLGTASTGWAIQIRNIMSYANTEKHYGESGYLKVHRQQKNEGCLEQEEEDWIEETGEFRSCRKYSQRKSVR